MSVFILIFGLGFLSCVLALYLLNYGKEIPRALGLIGDNVSAPGDWIKKDQIHVYENAVVIDVNSASLSEYAATGSMKPTLDENANGIRIQPKSADEIQKGDIVTFQKDSDLIVHRVIEKGEDAQGVWFITKGDNNNADDGKVYFNQIKYVTIGVLF